MKKELRYLPEFNAFGIEKIVLDNVAEAAILVLNSKCYEQMGLPVPSDDAPKVAFLLGQEIGYYTIDYNYALAIARTGAQIIFLDWHHVEAQLNGCHGLILPGGAFVSPKHFYAPFEREQHESVTSIRAAAYVTCIHRALFMGIPILGICAGAQMIAGVLGGYLFTDAKKLHEEVEHKTKQKEAHMVKIIVPRCLLKKLIGKKEFVVNSRHNEAVYELPYGSPLFIYAVAENGIPEAWGNDDENILCVQWHPEDYAAEGDVHHQRIYNWLTERAKAFKSRQK